MTPRVIETDTDLHPLGVGRSFEKAFELGKIAVDLRGIPEHEIPVLKKKA